MHRSGKSAFRLFAFDASALCAAIEVQAGQSPVVAVHGGAGAAVSGRSQAAPLHVLAVLLDFAVAAIAILSASPGGAGSGGCSQEFVPALPSAEIRASYSLNDPARQNVFRGRHRAVWRGARLAGAVSWGDGAPWKDLANIYCWQLACVQYIILLRIRNLSPPPVLSMGALGKSRC